MRVAIDIRSLAGERAGIGRYTETLIRSLGLADRENQYVLYGFFFKKFRSAISRAGALRQDNFSLRTRRVPYRLLKCLGRFSSFSLENLLGKMDILLSPDYLIPPQREGKLVVIV